MKQIIILSRYVVLSLVLFINYSYADEIQFSQPASFHLTEADEKNKSLPILVLFSSIYCDYCHFIKEEFLKPMLKSGDYVDKVIIKVVEDDIGDEVINFKGKLIDSGDFSERYDVTFTPTVIFIDATGQELTERIIGLSNVEYYGGALDEGIEASLLKIKINLATVSAQ